ncbi:unnamed protein product [Acanthoscelides obtectus]|uniref:Uncharacterized protein n=1 Tax=Acanthoscelides obtectus TaxID=200917 RepID=A0A9P0PUK5_ACAOB|nr:unnamed protein product [Acanthoscelides obtectus]CAK1670627.1 hypothetical protein AOBTE_LOCUS27720 [Acanthoscelides obtectus]
MHVSERACTALLNGLKLTKWTTLLKRPKSCVAASSWGRSMPTSSNSLTLNTAYPAACSNNTYHFSGYKQNHAHQ